MMMMLTTMSMMKNDDVDADDDTDAYCYHPFSLPSSRAPALYRLKLLHDMMGALS